MTKEQAVQRISDILVGYDNIPDHIVFTLEMMRSNIIADLISPRDAEMFINDFLGQSK